MLVDPQQILFVVKESYMHAKFVGQLLLSDGLPKNIYFTLKNF